MSRTSPGRRVLVVRLDSVGDVVLAGPTVLALAADAEVDVLCSTIGRPAAALLPGVAATMVFDAPWVLRDGPAVTTDAVDDVVGRVAARRYAAAAVLTSSHQSPLPMALLLRLANVPEIAAVSVDHAGRLLDHRLPGDPDLHEVERGLAVAAALGAAAPTDDALALDVPLPHPVADLVVVHPGSSAPARTLPVARWREVVAALVDAGHDVIVTGSIADRERCRIVADGVADVRTFDLDDLRTLVAVLATATVVVCGNTGPMHLAAAAGRPVAAVFAPTVPWRRWAPWRVPHRLLGDLDVECAGCRHVRCPLIEQRCLASVTPARVVAAVGELAAVPLTALVEATA